MARPTATGETLEVRGLTPLMRALKHVEDGADGFIKNQLLRPVGNRVRDRAQRNVEHKTGRHGDDGPIKVRTSATMRGISIYSDAPHSAVQDRGGMVGYGAIIPRARASHYMTKAVADSRRETERAFNDVLDLIEATYERG